tara:strand:+ start:602 stop:1105 length:504 start_codon:yes stop_codon:yes gene_type:complete
MARYKRYRYGGKRVPGMYAQDGKETPMNPVPPQMQSMNEKPTIQSSGEAQALRTQNQIVEQTMLENAMRQQQMAAMMQQMQMQNMLLQQQNQLQQVQIEKMDLINSARTTKKPVGPVNSPKRKGGSNSRKPRVNVVMSQGQGTTFRHGGGMGKKGKCLPGGRFSKRR